MPQKQHKLSIPLIVLLTIFVLFILSPRANSQPPTEQQAQSATEVSILRAQLETMRQYDEKLLSTVYWSLSSIGGFVLLIVGLGWYTNFRIYKRDVEDIKREVKDDLKGLDKALASSMETKLQSIKEEAKRAANDSTKFALNDAMRDLRELQYEILKVEAERWERKEVLANALYAYARMIGIIKDIHPDMYVPEIVENMIRLLKIGGYQLRPGPHAEILKSLEEIPPKFSADVEIIRSLIHQNRTA